MKKISFIGKTFLALQKTGGAKTSSGKNIRDISKTTCGGREMIANMHVAGKARFGPGVVSQVGEIAGSLGVKRAVLVADPSMEQCGYVSKVEKYLQEVGVECCIFAGEEPEPSVETTDAVVELAKEHDCELVVGLGGGSCLDVAKAVSVLITNEGSAAKYQGLGLVKNPGVPKILIPTTAGTGSEVTFTAVLIRKSDGVKGGINDDALYGEYSLLDPELTLSLPPFQTAATGMDALTHALEAYTSNQATPFSDIFAEEALRRIGRYIRVATQNGKDLHARCEMLLASYYGGIALANAGVGACHALAYPLGGMFGVPHGVANALLIPYVVGFSAFARPDRYARAAMLLNFESEWSSLRDRALYCAEGLHELVLDLDLPDTLRALKKRKIIPEYIKEEHYPEMAEKAMGVARPMENNPRPCSVEDCMEIYKTASGEEH